MEEVKLFEYQPTKSFTCCQNAMFYSPIGHWGEILKCDGCGSIWKISKKVEKKQRKPTENPVKTQSSTRQTPVKHKKNTRKTQAEHQRLNSSMMMKL